MIEMIRRALTRLGEVAAHPAAFALVVIYAGLWFAFDRKTLDWHAFATLGTLFMTLIIQRAEHRDTQALQAKLDEPPATSSQHSIRRSRRKSSGVENKKRPTAQHERSPQADKF